MITKNVKSEFGDYSEKVNHGHRVSVGFYNCIDSYKEVSDADLWECCPCCELKPRVWVFNNGEYTACGCGNSIYDHFSVRSESVMSVIFKNGGLNARGYDYDNLRKNWNEYCATMVNPCSHEDLQLEGKW